jgi:hypothetical protein
MSLILQARFGLRREESIKFQPSYADHGSFILLKNSWTKGGKERAIPIISPEQRAALDQAHKLAGAGSLIPPHRTYIQQRNIYDGECKAAGLSNMHGLRHLYAQTRYEQLTGFKCPAAGGPPRHLLTPGQRIFDGVARQVISNELGHERLQITVVYLGR